MLFEVSATNNDCTDKRSFDISGRPPAIDENEEPRHLIFIDYKNYVQR